jgi:hypothetical protein
MALCYRGRQDPADRLLKEAEMAGWGLGRWRGSTRNRVVGARASILGRGTPKPDVLMLGFGRVGGRKRRGVEAC